MITSKKCLPTRNIFDCLFHICVLVIGMDLQQKTELVLLHLREPGIEEIEGDITLTDDSSQQQLIRLL
ncbi:hypothetical protein HOLleu_06382 [Holothuria leucospilota]|uniref:Uncharacterized protein n=1 Tax=Holothuria leucospilota TaxID=206669 RepID=A0A9Q1CMS3_HOLLE|nr:hypothetical protein HOLleu_06382 [Holothuria leucospilota]